MAATNATITIKPIALSSVSWRKRSMAPLSPFPAAHPNGCRHPTTAIARSNPRQSARSHDYSEQGEWPLSNVSRYSDDSVLLRRGAVTRPDRVKALFNRVASALALGS